MKSLVILFAVLLIPTIIPESFSSESVFIIDISSQPKIDDVNNSNNIPRELIIFVGIISGTLVFAIVDWLTKNITNSDMLIIKQYKNRVNSIEISLFFLVGSGGFLILLFLLDIQNSTYYIILSIMIFVIIIIILWLMFSVFKLPIKLDRERRMKAIKFDSKISKAAHNPKKEFRKDSMSNF